MKKFSKTIVLVFPILLALSFSNCKKEIFHQGELTDLRTAAGSNPFNVHISFNAVETVCKKYKDPVDESPEKRHKLLATYQQEQTYDFSLDANNQNIQYVIDKIENSTPVEEWNKKDEGRPYKIVNDGSNITIFDRQARLIHRSHANASGISIQKMLQGIATTIDNRPIQVKMQELQSKGAEVQQDAGIYTVITRISNQNFKKNSLSVYSASSGKLYTSSIYDDVDEHKLKSFRLMKYNELGNPVEIYTEEYVDLPDGDKETSVTMLQLRNSEFIIN